MDESHFVNLTNRFNLRPNLLKIFFLSTYLHKLANPKQLADMMGPMIRSLGVDSRILTAILNIVNYKKIGWEILGINLTKPHIAIEEYDATSKQFKKVEVEAFDLISKVI